MVGNAYGILLDERDSARCREAVFRGLGIAQQSGVHLWDFMLLAQGVFNAVADGDLAETRSLLQRMRTNLPSARYLHACEYHYLCFMKAAYRSDTSTMKEHAAASLRAAQEAGVVWEEGYAWVACARVRFMHGEHDVAERCL